MHFQFQASILIVAMMEKVFYCNFHSLSFMPLGFLSSKEINLLLLITKAELPLEFPDGTTPVACRVSVFDSSTVKKVGVGALMDKASAPPLPVGSLYMEEVHVKVCFLSSSTLFVI